MSSTSAREISGPPQAAKVDGEEENVHDFWKPMDGLLRSVTSLVPTSPHPEPPPREDHTQVHTKINDLHARLDMLEGSLSMQPEAVGMMSMHSLQSPVSVDANGLATPERAASAETVPLSPTDGPQVVRAATVKSNFVFPVPGPQGQPANPIAMAEFENVHQTFDRMFKLEDSIIQDAASEDQKPAPEIHSVPDPAARACQMLWGGPTAPQEDDTILSWITNFYGSVTTAHGINRVFDDHNGILRRVFWFALFITSFILLVMTLSSTFNGFFEGEIVTNVNFEDASNVLPMMTICNVSPLRCACEAFYDADLINNDDHLKKIVPYACNEVVAYQEAQTFTVDANNKRTSYDVLERVDQKIDYARTRQLMLAFPDSRKLSCDNGDYTKDWVKAQVQAGSMSQFDLLQYAGYGDRGRLIRFCKHTDPETGDKASCMGDEYWSNPFFTASMGACHTLNPCHGFPVGEACDEDADCGHESEDSDDLQTKRIAGGVCNADGRCECNLCKAGTGCKVMQQLKPGKNQGIRLVANINAYLDAAIYSARRAIFNPGLLVHMHTQADKGAFGTAVTAGPGRVTELVIQQHKENKEQAFPFTNCSFKSITETETCEQNCLARVQAIRCCNLDIQQMQDGRFPTLAVADPTGDMISIDSPTLGCNAFDPDQNECMEEQTRLASEGTICLDAVRYEKTKWFYIKGISFFKNRVGWYDTEGDKDDDDISDQEEEAYAVAKHCVWNLQERTLPEDTVYFNGEEPNYGRPCENDDDCKSLTGEDARKGQCVDAYRAYCPGPCKRLGFRIAGQSNVRLSDSAARIIAAEELAWVTWQSNNLPATKRNWQPRCARDANGAYVDTDTCFTSAEAEALVKDNYAVVNVDYEHFQAEVLSQDEAMPITDLLGIFGGNLGMWVGMSIMTIVEWFELGIFAMLCMPFFYFGIKLPWIRRVEPEPPVPQSASVLEDETVGKVLHNLKEIANERKTTVESPVYAKGVGNGTLLRKGSKTSSEPSADKLSHSNGQGNGEKSNGEKTNGPTVDDAEMGKLGSSSIGQC